MQSKPTQTSEPVGRVAPALPNGLLFGAILGILILGLGPIGSVPKAFAQKPAFAASKESPGIDLTPTAAEAQEHIRKKLYFYQAFTRRDPFASLLDGQFEKKDDLVNIYDVDLVGMMSGTVDTYAMLEDGDGIGHILSVGDPVKHGKVVSIGDDTLVARVTNYGQTTNVTLKLKPKPDSLTGSRR